MIKIRSGIIIEYFLCFLRFAAGIVLIILLIPSPALLQQEYSIVFSPTVGDQLTYIMYTSVKAEGKDFSGRDISLSLNASGDISFDVKRIVHDTLLMALTTPGINIEAISINGVQNHCLKTQENKSLQATFDQRGSLREIYNLDAINSDRFMNISLAQILHDYFPVLPGRPVSIGEIWIDNRDIIIPFGGINLDVSIETKYMLQNVIPTAQGDLALISLTYMVALSGSKNFGEWVAGFEGKGTGEGLLNFLIHRGCFQEFGADYQTEGVFIIKNEDQALGEWPFHLSIFSSAALTNE